MTMQEAAELTSLHRREQVRLAIIADSQARRAWDNTLDLDNLDGTQQRWVEKTAKLIERWWHVSSKVAANYLPQYRQAAIGNPDGWDGQSLAVPTFDIRQTARNFDWLGATNVKWHIAQGLTQRHAYHQARALFLGVFHEAVLTGGRKTIEQWSNEDPKATGWRRVSDGNPCAFCAMLVTRGPIYKSEASAKAGDTSTGHYHPNCGCTVEPVYGDWQPTPQEQQWIDEYYKAAEQFPKGERVQENVLPVLRKNGVFRDSPIIRNRPKLPNGEPYSENFVRRMHTLTHPSTTHLPQTWPDNVQPPGRSLMNHIYYGEPDNQDKGGHLYGIGRMDKTEFPKEWTETKILEAISQVMESPEWEITSNDAFIQDHFAGTVDGVQIEIAVYKYEGRYIIDHVAPVGGDGVTRNTSNGKIPVKTSDYSRRKRWRRHENNNR